MTQERKPQRKKPKGKSWNTSREYEKPIKSGGYKKPKYKDWDTDK
jgi:hypothetical protein